MQWKEPPIPRRLARILGSQRAVCVLRKVGRQKKEKEEIDSTRASRETTVRTSTLPKVDESSQSLSRTKCYRGKNFHTESCSCTFCMGALWARDGLKGLVVSFTLRSEAVQREARRKLASAVWKYPRKHSMPQIDPEEQGIAGTLHPVARLESTLLDRSHHRILTWHHLVSTEHQTPSRSCEYLQRYTLHLNCI
jgi:hypothetical protein